MRQQRVKITYKKYTKNKQIEPIEFVKKKTKLQII